MEALNDVSLFNLKLITRKQLPLAFKEDLFCRCCHSLACGKPQLFNRHILLIQKVKQMAPANGLPFIFTEPVPHITVFAAPFTAYATFHATYHKSSV